MQAVIYTRVSLNRNGGRSTDDQERECRAECTRKDWNVRQVFCDSGISASRYGKPRPEWERCKDALRSDDVLVVWECSRAQRDLEEFVQLRNMCASLGVLLSYSGRVLDLSRGDDRFTGGLDALLAERESENLRERVLRGKRAGVEAGRPAGRCPWGYRLKEVAGIKVSGVWEPDPVEAPKVKEAVARILSGASHHSVWKWLQTQEGYRPVTLTVMNRSLRSPTIAGHRIHRGEIHGKGNWEPLITEAQHRQLLAKHSKLRAAKRFDTNPGPEPKHLLSCIATCGKCGRGLNWRRNHRNTPIYACSYGHVTRLADVADKKVEDRLFEILATVNPKKFEGDDPLIAAIWDDIADLDAELTKSRQMVMKGSLSLDSFALFEQDLLSKIAALEARAVPDEVGQLDLAGLAANWMDMSMIERRRIVRAFFTVVIEPARQGHKVGGAGIVVTPLKKRSDQ